VRVGDRNVRVPGDARDGDGGASGLSLSEPPMALVFKPTTTACMTKPIAYISEDGHDPGPNIVVYSITIGPPEIR
jgi:hypothetical protein